VYDAVVTMRYIISNVCHDEELAEGLTFDVLARDLIESEGVIGLADDEPEIVSIEQRVREE
jgi:hypothetical protein